MIKWLQRYKNRVVTLPFSILSIFIMLIAAITFAFIFIQSINFHKGIAYTSNALLTRASDEVENQIVRLLRPAELDAQFSVQLMKTGMIRDTNEDLVNYTYYLLMSLPLANGVTYGDEYGRQVYSSRKATNLIVTDVQDRKATPPARHLIYRDNQGKILKITNAAMNEDDPRVRPWYVKIKSLKQPAWSSVFHFPDEENKLGIVNAAPVIINNAFQGGFGIDFTLNYLSDFLNTQQVSKNGFAFILTDKEELLAYPHKSIFNQPYIKPNTLINVHQFHLPIIDQSIDLYKKTHKKKLEIKYNGQTYLIYYRPVEDLKQFGWLIGVVIPENDLVGPLKRANLITLIASLLFLIIGIYFVSKIISKLVKPIENLATEADKIKNFELGDVMQTSSRIKEVILLTNSMNNIKVGLNYFQKYVPKTLVRQLIQSGQEMRPGGEKKQLVIMFSDIENFTTISEAMDPDQLMLQLCEYFEALSTIIMEHQGTIDKYIGDSIMVLWGAPLNMDVKEASYKAASAALKCQEKIAELNQKWANNGKPIFNTRIGIHAGVAIVGNVGSNERLNYTAVGDAINVASRLEQINKSYHTHIIVSESIYTYIKESFNVNFIGSIEVKGRAQSINIYELINSIAH